MNDTLVLLAAFALICLAAHRVGRWFTAIGLPYITGYLAVGAAVGTFGLDLIPTAAAEELRFVDQLSLGVIAFVAGSELYFPDLRDRLRTIGAIAGGITVAGAIVLGGGIFALTGVLSFTADMAVAERIAVATLGAAVLLALSPPSTIAVIKEVGARGPFTSTVLSVTIVMDVVIVVAFAAASSLAAALLQGAGLNLTFLAVLALDLTIALVAGYGLGKLLGRVLALRVPNLVAIAVILLAGLGVYEAAGLIDNWSRNNLPFAIYIEPLLLTLVAGATVTNRTTQRSTFEELLHRVSPAVYVAFFTLTGLSLKLDTLVAVLPAAIALFVVRIAAIGVGASAGARLARVSGPLARSSWLALITQAGIALGLAREAGIQFPQLGESFATLIIAVIVLNEVFGPVFCKYVLARVGETEEEHERGVALIFGIDRNALLLGEQLEDEGWVTVLADDDPAHLETAGDAGNAAVLLRPPVTEYFATTEVLPDTVVAMSDSDRSNLALCRAAVDAGVPRTVARVNDPAALDAYHELGTLVIDPTRATYALLQEAVRAPDATSLVLHADPARETREIRIRSRRLHHRQLRRLALPQEVLVLAVRRNGSVIVPDGFTRLHLGDDLTLIGEPGALREAAARLS